MGALDSDQLLQLDFSVAPSLVHQAQAEYRDGTAQAKTCCPQSNFLKGCKWSPDGACLLTASEDKWLRVFDLPTDVLEALSRQDDAAQDTLSPALRVYGGELIYDYAWYPGMLASEPASCVFASSTRAQPVQLWDACTGEQRATYRTYDPMDEIEAAYSIAFSRDGSQLLAGFNNRLCVFDTSRPGRESSVLVTRKRKEDGLPGIVSCMACNPDFTSMTAVGSYSGVAALYALDNAELLFILQGHTGGITQVMFSLDGNYLYTGARRDSTLHCWDVRYTSGVVYSMERDTVNTNQRIAFDIEPCGRHLATGGEGGKVKVYDLTTGEAVNSFQAASDTVNGFMFHPGLPIAATATGHRRLAQVASDSDDEASPVPVSSPAQSNALQLWRFASHEPELTMMDATTVQERMDATDERPECTAEEENNQQKNDRACSHNVQNDEGQTTEPNSKLFGDHDLLSQGDMAPLSLGMDSRKHANGLASDETEPS